MIPGLQELIHKLEEGEGAKYIRVAFFILALLGLTAVWHIREAKNFASVEAMDCGQVGRNIAQGHGFSTDFVRPLSLAILQKQQGGSGSVLRGPHPDLANAPIYPVVLAGLMKVLPFSWEIPKQSQFWRYQPEVIIGWFNQILFFTGMLLVFQLARRMFDSAVGFLAVVLMALTELFWDFTTSGLSTMLLIVLFLWLVHLLVSFEKGIRETQRSRGWLLGIAAASGFVLGIIALTRYSMGWLIVPVVLFYGLYATNMRAAAASIAAGAFLLIMTPWIARNYQVSGTMFGIAGHAIHHENIVFPGNVLDRSLPKNLTLELNKVDLEQYTRKLFLNARDIVEREIPEAAGNWVAALFLVAVFVPYRNPALGRLKILTLSILAVLLIVQALGRTAYSDHSPKLNSENLLVIISPIFFIFGAAFFYTLLDQLELPFPWLRRLVVISFIFVLSLPLILRLLPPRNFPSEYPEKPYFAPIIQEASSWLQADELLMTDMPWATAWYGQRQSVWTTMDLGINRTDDFYEINDEHKAIKGIYLTPVTTNARFLSDMRRSREGVWGKFYVDAVVLNKSLPTGFPLRIAQPMWLPDQIFLTDRIRWHE